MQCNRRGLRAWWFIVLFLQQKEISTLLDIGPNRIHWVVITPLKLLHVHVPTYPINRRWLGEITHPWLTSNWIPGSKLKRAKALPFHAQNFQSYIPRFWHNAPSDLPLACKYEKYHNSSSCTENSKNPSIQFLNALEKYIPIPWLSWSNEERKGRKGKKRGGGGRRNYKLHEHAFKGQENLLELT